MSIETKLNDLSCDLQEILASFAAVRGPAFCDAVAIAFECRQLMEIVTRLYETSRTDRVEHAADLAESAMNMMSSILVKAVSETLSPQDLEDALSSADMLMKRRSDVLAKINTAAGRG